MEKSANHLETHLVLHVHGLALLLVLVSKLLSILHHAVNLVASQSGGTRDLDVLLLARALVCIPQTNETSVIIQAIRCHILVCTAQQRPASVAAHLEELLSFFVVVPLKVESSATRAAVLLNQWQRHKVRSQKSINPV